MSGLCTQLPQPKKLLATPLFPSVIQFEGVGRSRATFKKTIQTEKAFWRALEPFLFSKDIEYFYDPEKNEGEIVVGMFRRVGTFKRVIA